MKTFITFSFITLLSYLILIHSFPHLILRFYQIHSQRIIRLRSIPTFIKYSLLTSRKILAIPKNMEKELQIFPLNNSNANGLISSNSKVFSNLLTDYLTSSLAKTIEASLIDDLSNVESSIDVKSLVWFHEDRPLIILLASDTFVDRQLLCKFLNNSSIRDIRLATHQQVEAITGCKIGTVSPLGLLTPVEVIVDQSLVDRMQAKGLVYIYTGSGTSGKALRINLEAFIKSYNCPTLPLATNNNLQDISINNSLNDSKNNKQKEATSFERNLHESAAKNKFPYSSLRKLAASKDSEKFMKLLELFDQMNQHADGDNDRLDIDFPTGSGKTALQLAAWKGSIENVVELLKRGANVNTWSTNIGNYGKTAIFYAITKCREDIVIKLLEYGAIVKIVNNKGQSPRSLAASHLSSKILLAIENQEMIQSDIEWLNFRSTHSDGAVYGDIDPRFLDEKTIDFILSQSQHCNTSSDDTEVITKEQVLSGQVKSLFKTTFEMRYTNLKNDDEEALEAETDISTFPAVISAPTIQDEESGKSPVIHLPSYRLIDKDIASCDEALNVDQKDISQPSSFTASIGYQGLVELHATILSKRMCGKSLVFANAIPFRYSDTTSIAKPSSIDVRNFTKLSWHLQDISTSELLTSHPIALQLLVGKTMFDKYGDTYTRSVCKCITPGQGVKVIGQFSAMDETEDIIMNRLRLGNTTLDFIVHDYHILNNPIRERRIKKTLNNEKVNTTTIDRSEIDNLIITDEVASLEIEETKTYHNLKYLKNSFNVQYIDVDQPYSLQSNIVIVNDKSSITIMDQVINDLLSDQEHQNEIHPVGIDCEWRPQRERKIEYPVALLQLSIADYCFLVDVRVLCNQPEIVQNDDTSDIYFFPDLELELDKLLGKLFSNKNVIIIGFGMGQDLKKLRSSYPHLKSFQCFEKCLDLSTLGTKLKDTTFSKSKKGRSLSKLSSEILGCYLEKREQCSSWHIRPLTIEQTTYAAIDAIVLVEMYKTILQRYDDIHKLIKGCVHGVSFK